MDIFLKFLTKQGNLVVTTLQWDVAIKFFAKPGNKNYGSISVMVQWYSKPEYLLKIPSNAYSQPPKIEILAVRLMKKEGVDWDVCFNDFVKKLFFKKNWSVKKTMKKFFGVDVGINKKVFQLGIEEIRNLYDLVKNEAC